MFRFNRNTEIRKGDNKRVFTPKPKANSISFAICMGDLEGPGFHKRLLMFPGKPQTSAHCPSWISVGHGDEQGSGEGPGLQSWVSTI